MKPVIRNVGLVLVVPLVLLAGCGRGEPGKSMTVAELLEDPIYAQETTIRGEVGLMGDLFCPCFELTSGGASVMVWYDLMDDEGTLRPAVVVADIGNGDTVQVTGELRDPGQQRRISFWARAIAKT